MLQTRAYDTPYIEKTPIILVNFIAQEMILKYMEQNNKTSDKIAMVQVVTFIDLHNLNTFVMCFCIVINH